MSFLDGESDKTDNWWIIKLSLSDLFQLAESGS